MLFKIIPIPSLRVSKGRRKPDITDLKASIASIGLLSPITIFQNRFISDGYSRYLAIRELGFKNVLVWIVKKERTREALEREIESLKKKLAKSKVKR